MDVDNLGRLFQSGFGERANLSRVASLSFALRLFFEGWLPQLAAPVPSINDATDDLRDHLYLQYSGGDDVFIVGAWDALPEFARRVRQSLSEYAAGNPQVTLSAGISLAEAGFPLYQAAQQASEAEDSAKNFKRQAANGQEISKDAVAFMGMPLDWAAFATTKTMAYHLAQVIDARQIPRSTLQTVQALDGQIRQAERKARLDWLAQKGRQGKKYLPPKLLYGRWTWMAAYQLTRAAQGRGAEGKQLVEDIEKAFLQPDSRDQLRALGLSARWAQFLTRGG
jgi:CRISPR-associated protein Csm1